MDRDRVTIREHLGLRATADPRRWSFALTPRVLTPSGALHGGSGLAAAVEALEGSLGRPVIRVTAQYLHHAGPTGTLDVVVTSDIDGPQTTQARVTVSLGASEVLSASASLGVREFPAGGRWLEPPDVAAVADSTPVVTPPGAASILDHYEMRLGEGRTREELDGTPGSGQRAIWCRIPGGRRAVTAGDVALAGDLVVHALPEALGVPCSANSLDNTIRMAARAPSEWLLVDAHVDATIGGYAHARAGIWTDDGVLLGIASQTLVLRMVDGDGRSIRTNRRIVRG